VSYSNSSGQAPTIVYDLGMNNGDDTAYYLAKGLKVIGVDANPSMCAICRDRFSSEISAGQLTILNCGIHEHFGELSFYVNVSEPEISTFMPHKFNTRSQKWRSELVQVVPFSQIVASHGYPYFVKIDVEFCDRYVLRDMLANHILPTFVSAECHEIDVYCLLVAMGYEDFNLVSGATVHQKFENFLVHRLDGSRTGRSFRRLSSGPFGDDLRDGWTDKNAILARILDCGLGWIDLHAKL